MINQDKWINSIPKINNKFDENIKQLDSNRWVNTISKKTTYGSKNSYGSVKKYSLITILFVLFMLFPFKLVLLKRRKYKMCFFVFVQKQIRIS